MLNIHAFLCIFLEVDTSIHINWIPTDIGAKYGEIYTGTKNMCA